MTIQELNLAVPRYTSYPTVPYWDHEVFTLSGYEQTLKNAYWENSKEVSVYIHLPFCESMCTYCACNTYITKNHDVEEIYLSYLLKEWSLYLERFPETPIISEIHLGGGTPTFFSPANLEKLIAGVMSSAKTADQVHFSFEGHPANTTAKHLHSLYALGFDRVSFGIQDFDEEVQTLINRKQSYERVKYVTDTAREIGYASVNYDMVYGLPAQTSATMSATLAKLEGLKPDRIAYYSYAHVPQLKPAQRVFEQYLPTPEDKFALAQQGAVFLKNIGYLEIGMDHYCLPSDALLIAQQDRSLHRNFMGYTTAPSRLLAGLGVSAIGDTWAGFAQNEKTLRGYYRRLDNNELPIARGHLHTSTDLFIRIHILNLMCQMETRWLPEELLTHGVAFDHARLIALHEDGYIDYSEYGLKILSSGKRIVRLICSALDIDFQQAQTETTFSKAV